MKDLTSLLQGYFADRREYVPTLPHYWDFYGNDPDLEQGFEEWANMEEQPAEVKMLSKPQDLNLVEQAVYAAASIIYGAKPEEVTDIRRSLMMIGATEPIKVQATLSGEVPKTFYVKRPDMRRVLGKEWFNILSGEQKINFYFNEDAVVVDEVPGEMEITLGRQVYSNPKIVEAMARLDIISKILALSDLHNRYNLNITEEGRVLLFDFDHAFERFDVGDGFEYVRTLLETPEDERAYLTNCDEDENEKGYPVVRVPIDEIYRDERELILRRAMKEHERVEQLIDIMKQAGYEASIAHKLGFKTMGHYVEAQLDALGDWRKGWEEDI